MNVVEVFVPLLTGAGAPVSRERIHALISDLADRFGGATAFARQPAEGLWKRDGETERDWIVIVEVVVDQLDIEWWADYRRDLEAEFSQEVVLIRATPCRLL